MMLCLMVTPPPPPTFLGGSIHLPVVGGDAVLGLHGGELASLVVVQGFRCPLHVDLGSPDQDQTHVPCIRNTRISFRWSQPRVLYQPLGVCVSPNFLLQALRGVQAQSICRLTADQDGVPLGRLQN